jgi:carboxymethylenebutenolidase
MPIPGAVIDPSRVDAAATAIPTGSDAIKGYLARPTATGNHSGIVVIHEAFGLVEHIRDIARRFANIGFNAVAPDLYSRVGAPNPDNMDTVRPKMFGLHDRLVVRDLEACAALLRGLPNATQKVGVIGFCSGGRQTLLAACSSDQFDAAIDCWGGFITRANPENMITAERPTPVMDLVGRLACPLFAAFGEEDQNPTPSEADELKRRLDRAGKTSTVKVYSKAGHAFLADYRPSYREEPATELWRDIAVFFNTHLRPRS